MTRLHWKDVFHLFVTMDNIVASGSENREDWELASKLAHWLYERNHECPAMLFWINGGAIVIEEHAKAGYFS